MSSTRTGKSCVIVVENLPVPLDRRVWQEAQALRRAGLQVSVICPATADYPALFEVLEGVEIYRHPLPFQARGCWGFVVEYAAALYHEARLLQKIQRRRGVDVIQACNPPDLIFVAALPQLAMGARFIFDQHDLCPELFQAKFGRRGPFYWLLRAAERLTYACADQVVTANDAFREVAVSRGAKRERVASVYSYPDTTWLRAPQPQMGPHKPVLGYLGVIGDQDGVDGLVRAIDHLVHVDAFTDFRALIIGDGPALGSVTALAHELRVDDHITFTGLLTGEKLATQLAAFDIGLIPDPLNPSNDRMSMNKVFEYCALGVPTVAFPLTETRRLLGDAGVFAKGGTPGDLAEAALPLLRDGALRAELAEGARRRSLRFDWPREARKYLRVYDKCLRLPRALVFKERRPASGVLFPGE